MDLRRLPVADGHAHPFDPRRSGERGGDMQDPTRDVYAFAREWSISLDPPGRGVMENTLLVRRVLHDLATLLGCQDQPDAVVEARDVLYRSDPGAYIRRLFEDAAIDAVLLDTGSPIPADEGYEVPLDELSALLPARVHVIHRIEPTIRDLLREMPPFDALMERFMASIDEAVEAGAVGLKSVIAYWTGLDIRVHDEIEARRSYEAMLRRGEPLPVWYRSRDYVPDERVLRDYLFVQAMVRAGTHRVPVQIHTGFGDAPVLDMTKADPLLLRRVLNESALRDTALVLVHAGYPWVEGAAYLANQYDNVYIDLSEMIPMAGPGITTKLASILELAPVSKVMYGSDGFSIPETFWFAATEAKRSLAQVLDDLRARGWVRESEAFDVAKGILHDNATRLYELAPPQTDPV
jgi:hypothetical protein